MRTRLLVYVISSALCDMKRRLSVANLSSENKIADILTKCYSHHHSECEEVQTNVAMHYWALLRIHARHWRSKIDEDCSSLPASSSQRSRNHGFSVFHLIWSALLSSVMVQHCAFLPVDRMVILPCMLCYSWLLHHPPLTSILVFLQSRLQSLSGLPNVLQLWPGLHWGDQMESGGTPGCGDGREVSCSRVCVGESPSHHCWTMVEDRSCWWRRSCTCIQMTPSEEHYNWNGGLEVPGCWTTVMRKQGGRSNPHRLWPPMTRILSSPWL